jgi:hypothetical protein
MMTIWKYPIPIQDQFVVNLPPGATVLCVDVQHGAACLWALVDSSAPTQPRSFALRGTGHSVDGLTAREYIGTFQMSGGALVFHLFEM